MVKTKELTSTRLFGWLKKDHRNTLEAMEELQDVFMGLRYEGGPSFAKGVQDVGRKFEYVSQEILEHSDLEEKVLFPFIATHVPRLESVLTLMRSEHEGFKKQLKILKDCLKAFPQTQHHLEKSLLMKKMEDVSTYMLYLLMQHTRAENEMIHQILEKELHVDEKRELKNRVIRAL